MCFFINLADTNKNRRSNHNLNNEEKAWKKRKQKRK